MWSHMEDITPATEITPLRAARDARGMTREELAFRAHVSAKTIERLENERTAKPHRVTGHAIAAVLDCDFDDLWPRQEAAA
jgi:DNA-binding XRE family transcriptional regulator